jgi:hypothetical protein
VCDDEGVKVFDVTELSDPQFVHSVEMHHASSIYLARTYAYVAAGPQGLVILDITNPTEAYVDQVYNANGLINDAHDVKLGITNVSQFAYVADGKNGLRVVQLTSPEIPGNDGFSPRPNPCLVATRKLPKGGHALCVSRGMDRDRAVDESGNQIAVFGRVGARPLNRQEVLRMTRKPDGGLLQVSDDPFDRGQYFIHRRFVPAVRHIFSPCVNYRLLPSVTIGSISAFCAAVSTVRVDLVTESRCDDQSIQAPSTF